MVIAFGSVLVASLLMRRGTQVGSMTLLALLTIFAIGGIMRGYFRGAPPEGGNEGGRVVNQLEASWSRFHGRCRRARSYRTFVAFMALILILYGARAIFSDAGKLSREDATAGRIAVRPDVMVSKYAPIRHKPRSMNEDG